MRSLFKYSLLIKLFFLYVIFSNSKSLLYVGNLSFIVHVIYLIMCLHAPAKNLRNLRCALVLLRLVTSGLHRQTEFIIRKTIYYIANQYLIPNAVSHVIRNQLNNRRERRGYTTRILTLYRRSADCFI